MTTDTEAIDIIVRLVAYADQFRDGKTQGQLKNAHFDFDDILADARILLTQRGATP